MLFGIILYVYKKKSVWVQYLYFSSSLTTYHSSTVSHTRSGLKCAFIYDTVLIVWHFTCGWRDVSSIHSSSVQDVIYALRKAHMRSTPSVRSFPNVAFETVPMFVWLTMALSRPFKERQNPITNKLTQKNSPFRLVESYFRHAAASAVKTWKRGVLA